MSPMFLNNLIQNAPQREVPAKVDPMLAAPCKKPFDQEGWIFEIKWDGYRTIATVRDQIAKLTSRRNITFNKFEPVAEALSGLPYNAVLDGEMVVLDEKGRAYIKNLRRFISTGEGQLAYYVFDILHVKDRDVRSIALAKRKEILEGVLADINAPNILLTKHIENQGIALHEAAMKAHIEGIVAKNARSTYKEGQRTKDWQKIK